jgi:Holliday junction resolvase-like predicted endonuclease
VTHTNFSSTRKGDLAEYYAVTWLWDNGYEVFKNSGGNGPVDLVALDKAGKTILIDVKCDTWDEAIQRKKPKKGRTKKQIDLGVKILSFNPDTRQLRFVKHKT